MSTEQTKPKRLGKIRITEKFVTIQGEGIFIGFPAYFVRTWGCNLHCSWCDSKHSWEYGRKEATMYTVEELAADIAHVINDTNIALVVFTGGEPMLFERHIKVVIDMVNDLIDRSVTYLMETNGEVLPEALEPGDLTFSISPKAPSADAGAQFNADTARRWVESSHANYLYFKNVLEKEEDKDFIEMIAEATNRYAPMYVMPEGLTTEEVLARSPEVVEYCIEKGFLFCPREHINIWNTEKLR